MAALEEETFDPILCRSGKHVMPSWHGACKECHREARARRNNSEKQRRARALHAQGFVDYEAMRSAPEWIPTAAFMPYVLKAISQERADKDDSPIISDILEAARIGTRRFNRWANGESKSAAFNDVDRLLCELNLVHLWYAELSEFYNAAEEEVSNAA